jgi:hypothetical protein
MRAFPRVHEHEGALPERKGVDVEHESVPVRAHGRGAACASTGVPRSSMRARLCEHERESVLSEQRERARANTRARARSCKHEGVADIPKTLSAFPFASSPSERADKRASVCPYKHKGEGLLVQARGCRRHPENPLRTLFCKLPRREGRKIVAL